MADVTKYVVVRCEKWSPITGMTIKCFGPIDGREEAQKVCASRYYSGPEGCETVIYELEAP